MCLLALVILFSPLPTCPTSSDQGDTAECRHHAQDPPSHFPEGTERGGGGSQTGELFPVCVLICKMGSNNSTYLLSYQLDLNGRCLELGLTCSRCSINAFLSFFSLCPYFPVFQESRPVYQLQYMSWPDKGVPGNPDHVLAMVEAARRLQGSGLSPLCVHCRCRRRALWASGGDWDREAGRPVQGLAVTVPFPEARGHTCSRALD